MKGIGLNNILSMLLQGVARCFLIKIALKLSIFLRLNQKKHNAYKKNVHKNRNKIVEPQNQVII